MSILIDCQKTDLNDFTGPDLLSDEEDITPPLGISCQDVEYSESQVRTRRGFTQAWAANQIISTLYNWIQEQYQRLIYLSITATSVISRDLIANTEVTVVSSITGVGLSCIQAGFRLYMAFFSANGTEADDTKVWDGTFTSGVPNVENAFPSAIEGSALSGFPSWASFSEPSAGQVSAGLHYVALVGITYNGAQTPPGPISGGAFTPASFTSAGNKVLQVVITPSSVWPDNLASIQIAMTPVENSSRWFLIPGQIVGFARGSSLPLTFTINIDDVTLVGGGPTEITNTLFNQFVGPIEAHCLVSYNNRAVYIYRTLGPDLLSYAGALLISDPYLPQSANLEDNQLLLPESRDITTGFVLGSTLFCLGDAWTYAFSDSGDIPVNWAPPRLVSGNVGSPFIKGVTSNPAKGRAWVADRAGLYAFTGGAFSTVPASYLQTPDWNRINFDAPQNTFKVVENDTYRMVMVKAALDGATVATHIMAWDYTNGVTPGTNKGAGIRYCGLYTLSQFPGIGDIEVVQNVSSLVKELWISRGDAAGNVKRQMSVESGDVTLANPDKPTAAELAPLYEDDGVGINSKYRALMVTGSEQGVRSHAALAIRERGNGQINLTGYSFDQNMSVTITPITSAENSMSPGKRFVKKFDLQSEDLSIEIDNGDTVGSFFWLAAIRAYWQWWILER